MDYPCEGIPRVSASSSPSPCTNPVFSIADYRTRFHPLRDWREGIMAQSSQRAHRGHEAEKEMSLCGF